jgi:hypothetical protein
MSYKSLIRRLEHKSALSYTDTAQLKKARRTLSHKPALVARMDRLLGKPSAKDDDTGFEFGTYGDAS